jgi:putative Mg2+ transporter-C (MgtC) family protein
VVGLTTGATIWAVAAVGVTVGSGYVAAGALFTGIIILVLTGLNRLEWVITGRCELREVAIAFRPDGGKTRVRLQEVLDQYRIPDGQVHLRDGSADQQVLEASFCHRHREHRHVLADLARVPEVVGIAVSPGAS